MLAPIEDLERSLSRLPGLGRRSAQRAALQLVREKERLLKPLTEALERAAADVTCCSRCGAFTVRGKDPCDFCSDSTRDGALLCAVEEPAEAPEAEEAPAALEQGALKVAGTTAEDAAPQEKKAIDLYETAGTEAQDGGSAEPAAGQAAEEEAPAMAVYSGSPFPCATVTLPPEGLQLDLLAGRTPDRESEGQAEFDLTAQEYDTLLAQLDESGLDYTAQETADGNSGLVLVIVKAAN